MNTGNNRYIGARYVPKFSGAWDKTKVYEALEIVEHQGNSYTSKTFVPANIEIGNLTYWALTGNYNAQIEAYRLAVGVLEDDVEAFGLEVEKNTDKMYWISVKEKPYSAKGDGIADDTVAIQNAINAVPYGGKLVFPIGTYKITQPLVFDKGIVVEGTEPYYCYIMPVNCGGIVANNVTNLIFRNIGISLATRYTVTPNALVGIKVNGTDANRPSNHVYENIYVDGFETALSAQYIWSSVFDNFNVGNCHKGIVVSGLSVNNVVDNSSISCDGSADSRGIHFTGDVASEGWTISNTLINNCEIGIHGVATTHVLIEQSIIDHMKVNAILIQSSGVNFGGNWNISDTYIAMNGGAGDCAIKCGNAIANAQYHGNNISNNHILVYAGGVCNYGVNISGVADLLNTVDGNTIIGFTSADIMSIHGNNTLTNNHCLSVIANNIIGGDIVANNTGTQSYERSTNYSKIGDMKITYDEAAPLTGTWKRGDICYNVTPVAGGVVGWVCIAGGTPGTWKSFGTIAV